MSDKYLKSLTFPDLADRYVVGDSSLSVSGAAADAKTTGDALATKAEIDGAYEAMTVGNAEQLVSNIRVTDTDPYLFRTAGGSLEIGDREYPTLVGASVAKNQLAPELNSTNYNNETGVTSSFSNGVATFSSTVAGNGIKGTGTFAAQLGHKYLFAYSLKGTSGLKVRAFVSSTGVGAPDHTIAQSNVWENVAAIQSGTVNATNRIYIFGKDTTYTDLQVKNLIIIDLTQMLGSTIADYIYTLEQGTAGAGVAFCKKYGIGVGYTAYNAGTLQSTTPTKHTTVGFNQWDEEWENGTYDWNTGAKGTSNRIRSKNYIPVLSNTQYYIEADGNNVDVFYYDADKNFISPRYVEGGGLFTTPANCRYMNFSVYATYGTTYNHDICINLHWDGERDGEYEPYTKHEYDLGNDTLRGVFELNNGELKANGDVKTADGTITRKYGQVDLSTLAWTKSPNSDTSRWRFTSATLASLIKPTVNGNTMANVVCAKYVTDTANHAWLNSPQNVIAVDTLGNVGIYDETYSDATAFANAMSGIYLIYELATPTEEEGTAFQSPQIVSNWGTEEYTEANGIVVGHSTEYPQDLKAKVESAPNNPSADGDYIVKRENGENAYVPLVIPTELPTNPSTDGTYVLKATVSSGSTVLSWEAE